MGMQQNLPLLKIEDVTKLYHRGQETITAIGHISLTVQRGELVAIVGPSGSGKTTLTQVIGGLITPDQGRVLVDGKVLKKQSDKELSAYRNQKIGFVFQNFNLIPYYTAVENVAVPLIIAGKRSEERHKLATRYLEIVGLGNKIHRRVNELSGGERQRVAIARALVNRPEILITDEPTGSLDSVRGQEIMSILEKLNAEQEMTILMVTHDLMLAKRAERIIHIQDGQLVKR